MKILYATHGYKPAWRIGGPVHSVSEAAERLVKLGHEVTVFTSNSNLDEELDVPTGVPVDVDGVEVWYFRTEEPLKRYLPFVSYLSRSMGFLYAPGMRAELDRLVPRMDVVHTHMPFVYPTYAAARAALRHGKPLFYHQRGVFDPERLRFRGLKKRLFIRAFERPVMRKAATLIALTGAEEESYRALGVDTPCRVIPNGIDVSKFRQRPAVDAIAGIPSSATVILFMSRVHPVKGADRLLDAFFRVQADFPDSVLVVAGPDEWGMEAKYREAVAHAGLEGRVLFPGMMSGERKLDLLARADLFCLPSDAEGFSMAVLEALASGTAVLLSPGCHFPEVERAGAGVVAAADPAAIATALSGLLPDRDRLRRMGQAGLALVSRDYTWDRIAGRLAEAYADAVRGKGARKP